MIKGKDLNLYVIVAGVPAPFLHSTSCTLKTQSDILESTTKSGLSGKTFEYAKKYSFTLDIDGYCEILDPTNFYTIQLALQQSRKIIFTFTDNSHIIYSGTLLVTATNMGARFNEAASFNSEFQGDGDYAVTASPGPPIPVGYSVTIQDQLGNIIAIVPAPGTYNVLRFDVIDEGSSFPKTNQLIIMEGA